ncbi:MAG: tetratricopeptide repeat protein [Gammaproteobacteria bacterium]|nr:tetratricopeptide repeat protein [Gammaproteobacteria bacterium]
MSVHTFMMHLQAMLLAAALGMAGCTPPTVEEALAEAEKALAAGDVQAARIHLMNLLQREEKNVDGQVRLAELDLDAGEAAAAELGFRRAARLAPDNARVRAGMARAIGQQDRLDEALKYLGEAAAADPADHASLLAVKAALLQQKGDPQAAHAAYATALELAPADPERFAALAQADLVLGRTLDAEWRISQAMAIDRDHVGAHLAQGSLQMQGRQPTGAVVSFRRAAELADKRHQRQLRVSALLALVEAQLLDADTKAVEETIGTLNAVAPGVVQAQFLRAKLAARTGNEKAAIEELLAVLQKVPENAPAKRLLGLVYARSDKLNMAEQYLRSAVARQPADEAVRDALAAVEAGKTSTVVPGTWPAATPPGAAAAKELARALSALQKGDLRAAFGLAENILRREPRNAEALSLKGGVLMATGVPAGALAPLENAHRLDPRRVSHAVNLARAYLMAGNPDAAAILLARATVLGAAASDLGDLAFRLALARREFDAARKALDQLAPAPRKTPAALWLEADLFEAEGKRAEAAQSLEAALALDAGNRLLATRAAQARAAAGKPDADVPLAMWLSRNGAAADVSYALASLAQGAGDNAAVRRHLAEALAADSTFAPALNDMAWQVLADGDTRKAVDYAERALRAQPRDPRIMDTAGWLRFQAGQREQGLPLLELAARLAPTEREIQYHLAVALGDVDRANEARPVLESLLASSAAFPGREDADALRSRLRAGQRAVVDNGKPGG